MIIGRRGFITGLAALVAAPAIVRVEMIMPVSARHTPLYVPIDWLAEKYNMQPFPLNEQDKQFLADLKPHAWSRPMADNWVDLNDHDPTFVKQWVRALDWGSGQHWWGDVTELS